MSDEEDLDQIRKEIRAAEEVLETPLGASVERQIRDLMAQVRALESAREAEKADRYKLRQKKIEMAREAEAIESRIVRRKEQERQAADMAEKFFAMEMMTADAPWRLGVKQEDGRVFKIMPHQDEAAKFFANAKRVLCADDMGLGKTIESIAGGDYMGAKRILVLAPGEVMSGWSKEYKMWAKRRGVMVIGRKPKNDQFYRIKMIRESGKDTFVVICNYESWARNTKLLDHLISLNFDTVILDEAHRVKNMKGNAYAGVEKIIQAQNICGECNGQVIDKMCIENPSHSMWNAVRSVENLMCLTGTPILNRINEIYPILHLINDRAFPSERGFLTTFAYEAEPGQWYFKEGGMAALASKLQSFYIRRTLKDTGITLPPQEIQVHELELTPEEYPLQCEIIDMLRKHAAIMIDDNPAMKIAAMIALITRQRQAAVWPGGIWTTRQLEDENGMPRFDMEGNPITERWYIGDNFKESIKIDRTMELLKEYKEDGQRTVIFSAFKEVLNEIERRCLSDGIRAATFHGDTSREDRDAVKSNFDRNSTEPAKWDVVLCHYNAGGVGVTFTAATRMILTDEPWNDGIETQALARINRIGQTEDTHVDVLRINDNIDVWLAALIEKKRQTVGAFNKENQAFQELRDMLKGIAPKEK